MQETHRQQLKLLRSFDSTISFYDKAPIIASIGYLLIASSLPLFLILRFAAKMKRLDNEKIIALYEKEISGVKKVEILNKMQV